MLKMCSEREGAHYQGHIRGVVSVGQGVWWGLVRGWERGKLGGGEAISAGQLPG